MIRYSPEASEDRGIIADVACDEAFPPWESAIGFAGTSVAERPRCAAIVMDDPVARVLALETAVAGMMAEGTRVLRIANPLRAPLTLRRMLIQLGADDDVEDGAASLLYTLDQRAAEGRAALVIEQAETLEPAALPMLRHLATHPESVGLVVSGTAAFWSLLDDESLASLRHALGGPDAVPETKPATASFPAVSKGSEPEQIVMGGGVLGGGVLGGDAFERGVSEPIAPRRITLGTPFGGAASETNAPAPLQAWRAERMDVRARAAGPSASREPVAEAAPPWERSHAPLVEPEMTPPSPRGRWGRGVGALFLGSVALALLLTPESWLRESPRGQEPGPSAAMPAEAGVPLEASRIAPAPPASVVAAMAPAPSTLTPEPVPAVLDRDGTTEAAPVAVAARPETETPPAPASVSQGTAATPMPSESGAGTAPLPPVPTPAEAREPAAPPAMPVVAPPLPPVDAPNREALAPSPPVSVPLPPAREERGAVSPAAPAAPPGGTAWTLSPNDRVFIHYRGGSAANEAAAKRLMAAATPLGTKVRTLSVPATPTAGEIRFFHPEDQARAKALADALRDLEPKLIVRDFGSYRPAPLVGLIEVWLPSW